MTRPRLSLLAAATLALLPESAFAGGFSTARFGGERGGHPAATTITNIYYNPAALTQSSGTSVYMEGLLALRSVEYVRPEAAIDNVGTGTPDDAISANAGTANLDDMLVSPFIGIVSDFGVEGLAVGAGVYVPFGGQAEWDKNDEYAGSQEYPGAVDGVQRWGIISGQIRSIYVTAGGAYEIPDTGLSFGATLNVVSTKVDTLRARTAQGRDDLVRPDGELLEGRTLTQADGLSLAAGLGVHYQLGDLALGASYQSQPGFGSADLEGSAYNQLGLTPEGVFDIEFLQDLPDIVRIGAAYRISPVAEVRLSGDYQRWSVFESQCVLNKAIENRACVTNPDGSVTEGEGAGIVLRLPRNYNDTFGVRLGGSYWPMPALEVMGGVSYDSNAAPDSGIDTALFDMPKILGTAGVRYMLLDDALELHLSYLEVIYFEREVEPRDTDPQAPSRSPDPAGTYSQSVRVITAGAGYSF